MFDLPPDAPPLSVIGGGAAARKTLWLFGPGASAHLGFPLPQGFLRATVSMLLGSVGRANEMGLDIGRTSEHPAFRKADGTLIANWEVRSMKEHPELAFAHLGLLDYFTTDARTRLRLAPLVEQLGQLRRLLADVGIDPPAADLLQRGPRDLLNEIARIEVSKAADETRRGEDDTELDRAIRRARTCVSRIGALALLEFNDQARRRVEADWRTSRYEQLVRRGTFDRNCRIVSLCCDTALDEAIFRSYRGSWTYGALDLAGIHGLRLQPAGDVDLLLIKPHGSINMLPCGRCRGVHLQWLRSFLPVGPDEPATISRVCPACGERATASDGAEDGWVLPELYRAVQIDESRIAIRDAFGWAEQIVSVGYDFPTQDAWLLDVVVEGLNANPHPCVEMWLVLAGETNAVRDRLVALDEFSAWHDNRVRIHATDSLGFEAVG